MVWFLLCRYLWIWNNESKMRTSQPMQYHITMVWFLLCRYLWIWNNESKMRTSQPMQYHITFQAPSLMVTILSFCVCLWAACIWNSHPRQRHCCLSVSSGPNCGLGISFRCVSSCFFNCRIFLFVLSLPTKICSSRCLV